MGLPKSPIKRFRNIYTTLTRLPGTTQWIYLLYGTFAFLNGFGLWLMHNPLAFDRSPDACTSTTVFWIMGHNISVTSPGFRAALITIYTLFLVPGLNVALLFIVWFLVWISVDNLALRPSEELIQFWVQASFPFPFGIINAILIVMTRMTMHANTVSSEDQEWHLGQIFGLVVAVFAAGSILEQFGSESPEDGGDDNKEGQKVGKDEGA
ncbi:hypothetical protein DL93DRAFT_2154882 [Clavulina sp. PMI_390]|nr:hypothetical protein DL93DRAFT_2154882 [Clavulina sp. PMI_390]